MDEYIEIPLDQLSEDALRSLIEEFTLREGTDYGTNVYSLKQKTDNILKQLKNNKLKVVYDPDLESPNIVTEQQLQSLKNHSNL